MRDAQDFVSSAVQFTNRVHDHLWCQNERLCWFILFFCVGSEFEDTLLSVKRRVLDKNVTDCKLCCTKYHDMLIELSQRTKGEKVRLILQKRDDERIIRKLKSVRCLQNELEKNFCMQKMLEPVLFELMSYPILLQNQELSALFSEVVKYKGVSLQFGGRPLSWGLLALGA